MARIARHTTPAFTYKPSAVEMSAITKVFLVIKQDGSPLITKDITTANITEDGYTWTLSQEETRSLASRKSVTAQVDYLTSGGMRYTTIPKAYDITESAINEVI